MGGRTGRRAKPPWKCWRCGGKIRGSFLRTRKGDEHHGEKCVSKVKKICGPLNGTRACETCSEGDRIKEAFLVTLKLPANMTAEEMAELIQDAVISLSRYWQNPFDLNRNPVKVRHLEMPTEDWKETKRESP